jgi:hypothetical protein
MAGLTRPQEEAMRNLFRQALMIAVAATLGALGTVFVASAAHAFPINTIIEVASTLRACDSNNTATCPRDTSSQVPANIAVTSFCSLGTFDLLYTGPGDRRAGFVPRANLDDTGQFTPCNSNPEFGIVVNTASTLRSCAGTGCQSFGNIPQNAAGGAFCRRSTFVLVYIGPLAGSSAGNRGGFLPASALSGNIPTAFC